MSSENPTSEERTSALNDFLSHEVNEILATGEEDGVGWTSWTGAAARTRNYTDEQLIALFKHAHTRPWFYDIKTRGESEVDFTKISPGETWDDFWRRVAARVLQYELVGADLNRKQHSGPDK